MLNLSNKKSLYFLGLFDIIPFICHSHFFKLKDFPSKNLNTFKVETDLIERKRNSKIVFFACR